jgi:hypothetical protein
LTAGQSQTVDFTLRLIPVDASLVLDLNDPLGQVRNSVSGIPTDPDELVFRRHTSGLIPINAPDGHQLTLQEWSAARGTSSINCNGTTTNYQLSLQGLIPNGTYTIWNNIFGSTKRPGSPVDDQVAGGALGASNGSENAFIASATGSATLSLTVGGGDALGFGGNQPDCALTDARGIILVVLYHLDHQTWGSSTGPEDTWVDHLLFYY